MELYKHTLEQGNILGADKIRLFSFFLPENEDPAQFKNLVLDRMGLIAETAKQFGIKACHENEKGIYGAVASRCLEIHQAVPELGGIFDPANYVQCGVDTAKGWDLLKDRVFYLHIKDALPNGRVVPAGKGAGNVAHIVKEYLSMGGNAMTLEPHLKVFDGLAALEESGDTSVVGQEYTYPTADAAFDAACSALKTILEEK
jgi:sugar phosphate isomerase/epimerase